MSTFRSLGVLAACALYQQAQAAPITFEFEAVVDSARGPLCRAVPGEVFSGNYTFESTATGSGGSFSSLGAPYGMRLDLSSGAFPVYGFLSIRVSPPGSYIVVADENEATIGLDIQTNLSDASLPLVPPPLVGNSTISMNIVGGTACVLRGHLTSLVARPRGNGLYDSFSGEFIDPRLWNNSLPCRSLHTFECVRELRGDKLQLGLRTYGSSSTDIGTNDDAVGLTFQSGNPITTIVSDVIVNDVDAVGCPENPEASRADAKIHGTFFSTGDPFPGLPLIHVSAGITISGRSDLPRGELVVTGFVNTVTHFVVPEVRGSLGEVDLGRIWVGERVRAVLRWDHALDRFVFRLEREDSSYAVATIAYTLQDLSPPPGQGFKQLATHTAAANCESDSSVASIKASFFDVRLNQGALP